MGIVSRLERYEDDAGNVIEYDGPLVENIKVKFVGANNRLVVDARARIGSLVIDFDCDNGQCLIGSNKGVPKFSAMIRVGQDSRVQIGSNVSVTAPVAMSATEGTTIEVGDDVMFASENQVRADDGHPIFYVATGRRANVSRSIHIGSHVWLARGAAVLGGSQIGDGSVVGMNAVLKGTIANNCIAVGNPAKVVRRDIAWERPHLSLRKPYYKPDATTITKTEKYWNMTSEPASVTTMTRLRRRIGRLRRRLRQRTSNGS